MAAKFLPLLLIGLSLVPGHLAFNATECGRFTGDARSLTTVVAYYSSTGTAPTKAYILGGLKGKEGSYEQLTDIIEYDLATGVSTYRGGRFPIPVSHGAATFHGDSKTIYYFGGGIPQEGKYDTHIFKLTIIAATPQVPERIKAELQTVRLRQGRAGASAVSMGGFMYIFGGYTAEGKSSEIIKYDLANPTLQQTVAHLPYKSAPTSTVVNGNDVFIFGEQNYVSLYNVDSEVASNVTSLQHVPTSSVAVQISNTVAYVLGTNQAEDGFKQNKFDITGKTTSQVCAGSVFPDGISGSTIYDKTGNKIMIFGGNMTNSLRQSVLCIDASPTNMDKSCPKEENAASSLSIQLATFLFTFFAVKFNLC